MKYIDTERLLLRRLREDDAEAMFAGWASDPEVARHLAWESHKCVSQTRKWMDKWVAGVNTHSFLGIVLKTDSILGRAGSTARYLDIDGLNMREYFAKKRLGEETSTEQPIRGTTFSWQAVPRKLTIRPARETHLLIFSKALSHVRLQLCQAERYLDCGMQIRQGRPVLFLEESFQFTRFYRHWR